MNAVQYKDLERAIARRAQWDPDLLDAGQWKDIRDAISEALDEAWRFAWWSFLLVTKQRQFAKDWSASATYLPGAVVYHVGSDQYYQAVKSGTVLEPASLVSGVWVESAEWVVWGGPQSAPVFSETQAYPAGSVVTWKQTRRRYKCHTGAAAGVTPDTIANWGAINDRGPLRIDGDESGFEPIGDARRATVTDPDKDPAALVLQHRMSLDDVLLFEGAPNRPWLQWLPPAPQFTGELWDASLSYGPEQSTEENDMAQKGYNGFAQLRAETRHADRDVALVFYGETEGDGAGGWYRFVASSAEADNNETRLRPNDNPVPALGCWHFWKN